MNSAVGTIFYSHTSSQPIGSPVGGGWLSGASYNSSQNTWLTYGKMTAFTRPGPANTFVFMDENPRTINDGSIAISANATAGRTYLIDYPASNHNTAVPISFADGHVIVHKLQDQRTYTVVVNGQGNLVQNATQQTPDNPDCFYLAPITSAAR
jgi:prepilin-type processing-associated H-X9-DG protein